MDFCKLSYRLRRKGIFGLAIILFCSFAVIQIFPVPKRRLSTRTEPYKLVEGELAVSKRTTGPRKVDKEQILQFQPDADVVLPTSHIVQLSGLQRLPDKFLANLKRPRVQMNYRLQPGRIVGKYGLLAIREFQGNTWLGTLMKGAVVFFVQSATNHLRRRMLVRETWASIRDIEAWKIEVVFVMGLSYDVETQTQLSRENRKFGDILQYQGADKFRYSTVKMLAGIQWATRNLPQDFFYAFASDDTLVNVVAIRDFLSTNNPHGDPPGHHVITAIDGSTVTSCQQQKINCFETFQKQEVTERNLNLERSVEAEDYDAQFWPPYCTEGLYILPVSFATELYEQSRRTNLTLPHELHDVLITGILRRKLNRGDKNINSATKQLRSTTLLRLEILPRSSSRKLAHYELQAETQIRSMWKRWYELIRYRFHIFTKVNNAKLT